MVACFEFKKGDLTQESVDAIVNPSNSFGVMGGGVAYAIKMKGGEVIESEAVRQAPIHVGEAVCTTAGSLLSRHVIHSSTMEHPSEIIGVENVGRAVWAALSCASKHQIESISFPGMGTGVGGVLADEAARAMISRACVFLDENPHSSVKKVYFVAFSDELYEAFIRWSNRLLETK